MVYSLRKISNHSLPTPQKYSHNSRNNLLGRSGWSRTTSNRALISRGACARCLSRSRRRRRDTLGADGRCDCAIYSGSGRSGLNNLATTLCNSLCDRACGEVRCYNLSGNHFLGGRRRGRASSGWAFTRRSRSSCLRGCRCRRRNTFGANSRCDCAIYSGSGRSGLNNLATTLCKSLRDRACREVGCHNLGSNDVLG